MIREDIREYISEVNPDAVLFDNPSFDNSIIGLSDNDCVIYDIDLMIKELSEEDSITEEEALEFIDYNTLRSLGYYNLEYKPIVMTTNIREVI